MKLRPTVSGLIVLVLLLGALNCVGLRSWILNGSLDHRTAQIYPDCHEQDSAPDHNALLDCCKEDIPGILNGKILSQHVVLATLGALDETPFLPQDVRARRIQILSPPPKTTSPHHLPLGSRAPPLA